MRRVHLILPFLIFAFLLPFITQAQNGAPLSFNYQAVARDVTTGTVLADLVNVPVVITLTDNVIIVTENHTVTTNKYGLFTLNIGSKTAANIFNSLNWAGGNVFVSVSVNGVSIGSNKQLLSVPYALYANSAGNPTLSGTKKSYQSGNGISIDTSVLNTIKITNTYNFDSASYVKSGVAIIGGDLTGTYPAPTIGTGKITVDKLAPLLPFSPPQILVWNGNAWTIQPLPPGSTPITTGNALSINLTTNRLTIKTDGSIDTVNNFLSVKKVTDSVIESISANKITKSGALPSDVLQWNGKQWGPAQLPTVLASKAIVARTPLQKATGLLSDTIIIGQAGKITDGYLNSQDWNTFNNNGVLSPSNGDIIYFYGGSWQKLSFPTNPDSLHTIKNGASGPYWGSDLIGVAGSGINIINGFKEPTQTISVGVFPNDTITKPQVLSVKVGTGAVHIVKLPVIGNTGVGYGLLSQTDYKAFKNATIGSTYTVGAGLTKSGNNIRLNINGTLDTIGGILKVKAARIDSTQIIKRKLALIGLAGDGALNNEVLTYDTTSRSWKPKSSSGGGGLWLSAGNDIYNSNTGNVGIGLNNPADILHIKTSTKIASINVESDFAASGPQLRLNNLNGQDWRLISNGTINTAPLGTFSIYNSFLKKDLVVIDTAGQVGIGTILPSAKLHVGGYIKSDKIRSIDDNPRLLIAKIDGTIDTLKSSTGVLTTNGGVISWMPGASQAWSLGGNNISATDYFGTTAGNANFLKIKTNAKPRIIVDSSGKVGIGTGDAVSTRAFLEQQGSTSGVAAIFGGEAAGVSLLSSTSGIGFNQYINSFVKSISSGFGGFIAVDNANSGEMWFGTSTKATAADEKVTSTTKMTLSQSGSLGIGLKPLNKLHVNGNIRLDSLRGPDTNFVAVTPTGLLIRTKSSSNLGWDLSGNDIIPGQFIGTTSPTDSFIIKTNNQTRIAISPNSTNVGIGGLPLSNATLAVYGNLVSGSISNPSDIRYKKNVAKIDGALQKVSKLNGVSYNWKREDFAQMNFMEGKDFGLIAQEVELVFPELVLTDERGFKSVRYTQLIPFLLEAIKEQQKQIENLSNEVHLKDANLKVVENKINSLETSISTMNSQMQLLLKSIGNPAEVVSSK